MSMAITPWSTIITAISLVGLPVHAQDNRAPDPNNQFIYPGLPGPQSSNDPHVFASDLNFTVGVTIDIPFKWTTNMTNYSLVLFQEAPPQEYQTVPLLGCGDNPNYLYWDGDIGSIDLKISYYAYLGVYNCSDSDPNKAPFFFSHYFNLTEPAAKTTTTSTIATSSQQASSAATSSSPGGRSGSSNAVAIGAGIGGGLSGATLLAALAGFLICKRRSRNTKVGPSHSSNAHYQAPALGKNHGKSEVHESLFEIGVSRAPMYDQPQFQTQHYPLHELSATTYSGTDQASSLSRGELSVSTPTA